MPPKPKTKKPGLSKKLLAWYDVHRRVLPWRAPAGKRADPYRVWLSEIMLQQTTVQAVGNYYRKFLAKWPDVKALADARQDEVLAACVGDDRLAHLHSKLAFQEPLVTEDGERGRGQACPRGAAPGKYLRVGALFACEKGAHVGAAQWLAISLPARQDNTRGNVVEKSVLSTGVQQQSGLQIQLGILLGPRYQIIDDPCGRFPRDQSRVDTVHDSHSTRARTLSQPARHKLACGARSALGDRTLGLTVYT